MKNGMRSGLLACAFLALVGLSGCGSSSTSSVPQTVTVFYAHGAAIDGSGTLSTWGYNAFGQLGDATLTTRSTPQAVPNLAKVSNFAVGAVHTLAITSDSTAWAWGSNATGQLGSPSVAVGSSANSSVPVKVMLDANTVLPKVTSVAAGFFHSLAVSNGTVYAWGDNTYGQIGDGSNTQRPLPVTVTQDKNSPATPLTSTTQVQVQVAAGFYHSLALVDHKVFAWGNNINGQLGPNINVGTNSNIAIQVPIDRVTTSPVKAVAAAGNYSLALTEKGEVLAWGYNLGGQIGLDPATASSVPFPRIVLAGVAAIAAGSQHVLALMNDGTIQSWGQDFFGQLGNNAKDTTTLTIGGVVYNESYTPVTALIGGTTTPPVSDTPITGVTPIYAIGNTSFARNSTGLYAWGDNGQGQCGVPSTTTSVGYLQLPTPLPGL